MAATSIARQTIKRSQPMVRECFRGAFLHEPLPEVAAALSRTPQLVVLLPWVGAKDKHAYKFVDAWKKRGFYVMHVSSSVKDLALPKTGTEVRAMKVAEFLMDKEQRDFNIIIHGISVGGYFSLKLLMTLQQTDTLSRITHQIYDSFAHIDGFKHGIEHGVPPYLKKIAKATVAIYKQYADLTCLYESAYFGDEVPAHSPILYMHSIADNVARHDDITHMTKCLARGSPVSLFLLPKEMNIGHVDILRSMGETSYMSTIIRFLKKNNFAALQNEILQEEDPNSKTALENESRVKFVEPYQGIISKKIYAL